MKQDEIVSFQAKFDHAMAMKYVCQKKRNGNEGLVLLRALICKICSGSLFGLFFLFLLLSVLLHPWKLFSKNDPYPQCGKGKPIS